MFSTNQNKHSFPFSSLVQRSATKTNHVRFPALLHISRAGHYTFSRAWQSMHLSVSSSDWLSAPFAFTGLHNWLTRTEWDSRILKGLPFLWRNRLYRWVVK